MIRKIYTKKNKIFCLHLSSSKNYSIYFQVCSFQFMKFKGITVCTLKKDINTSGQIQ